MDHNTQEQILNLIDKSQRILLLTHAKADCDGLGSMISMYLALKQLGKEVTAATNDPAPEVLSFLPSIHIVQNSVSSNDFIITLDITSTPLNKIRYKLSDDHSKVNIIVTPKGGQFRSENVSFGSEEASFDLIITFDTGNLEHLGPIYDQNAELFFKTPIINIDHHASNTDYGQINYVDPVAASTTEVMLGLLEGMEKRYQKKFLNADVATLLMAGLITDTGSFQHANTSPRAMEVAARLLDLGARQQEIIKNIYKTKKLSTLKLWGMVLSKVETDPIYRLVWSSINKNDLTEANAGSEEGEGIIDDLLSNAPGAEIIMLFKYNNEGYVSVSMRSTSNSVDVGKICSEMGGGGHIRAAGFKRRDGSSLEKLIEDTLTKVREYQGQRLNIHPDMLTKREEFIVKPPVENKKPEEGAADKPKNPETVQYLEFKDERSPAPKSTEKPVAKNENAAPKKAPKEDKDTKPENSSRTSKNAAQPEARKSVETLKREFVSKPSEKAPANKPEQSPKAEKKEVQVSAPKAPKTEQKPSQTPEPQATQQSPATPTPAPKTDSGAQDTPNQEIPPAPAE